MKLRDKIVILTGASRGIGRAVAHKFTREGATVVAVARNTALLDSLIAEVAKDGGKAIKVEADVTADQECRALVQRTMSWFGRIDVLVNNAGLLGSRNEITSIEPEEWDRVFAANVKSAFMLSKYAATHMKEKNSGSIINVTSGVVRHPQPNWGSYLPSKFAVEGFTMMLAEELKDFGIRVNMIDPGRTNTDMVQLAFPDIPRNSFKHTDDVVEPFVFLASDESRLVTGTRIKIR